MMQLSKTFLNIKQALLRGTAKRYPQVDPYTIPSQHATDTLEADVPVPDAAPKSFYVVRGWKVESATPERRYVMANSSDSSLDASSPASSYNPSIFTHHNPSMSTTLTEPTPSPAGISAVHCPKSDVLDLDKVYEDLLIAAGEMSPSACTASSQLDDWEYEPAPTSVFFRHNPQYDSFDNSEFEYDSVLEEYLGEIFSDAGIESSLPPASDSDLLGFTGVKETTSFPKERRSCLWGCVDGPIPSPLGFSVVVPSRRGGAYPTPARSFMFGVGMSYFKPLVKHLAEETGRSLGEDMVLVSKVYPDAIYDQPSLDKWVKWSNGRNAEDRILWLLQ